MIRIKIFLLIGALSFALNGNGQCGGISVDAGSGDVFCSPGGTAQLDGRITGPYLDFEWTPPDGLSNPNSLNPNATVTTTTTYTLTATAVSDVNLVQNGDFGGGAGGFTSSYTYVPPGPGALVPEGVYTVHSNPNFSHSGFSPCGDHTSGSGNMMIINGAGTPGTDVWCQTVPVNPNTDYIFHIWATSVNPGSPAILQFSINSSSLGATFTLSSSTCAWVEYTATWNSGGASSATICIVNQNTALGGNDFALDDIGFYEVCEVTDEVTIEVIDILALIGAPPSLDCITTTGILNATGSTIGAGFTLEWNTPDGFIISGEQTLTPVVGAPGTYTLTIYGPEGCEAEATVIVTGDMTVPEAEAYAEDILCGNTDAAVEGMSDLSGSMFMWNGPNGFFSTIPTFLTTEPGVYYLTITAPNGCTDTVSVRVNDFRTEPEILLEVDTLDCVNTSVSIYSDSPDQIAVYSWEGPGNFSSSDNEPSITLAGTYSVTATDANGCFVIETIQVYADTILPNAILEAGIIDCRTDSALLGLISSNASSFFWLLPNGNTSMDTIFWTQIPGEYEFSAIGSNGCESVFLIDVAADTLPPTINTTNATMACMDDSVQISVNSVDPGVSFYWSGPDGFISTDTAPFVFVNGDYNIQATGPNGCITETIVTVVPDINVPQIDIVGDTINCDKPNVQLFGNTDAVGGIYTWVGPNGFLDNGLSVSVSEGGWYTLTVVDSIGCDASLSYFVEIDLISPDFILTTDTITCSESTAQLIALGPDNYTYSWVGPNGFQEMGSEILTTESGSYVVTAVGENGCSSQETIEVISDTSAAILEIFGSEINCTEPEANISVVADIHGTYFNWSGPAGFTSLDSFFTTSEAGLYSLMAISPNGCISTADFNVVQDIDPPIITTSDGVIDCSSPSLILNTITQETGLLFTWSGPVGFISSQENPMISEPGLYTLEATGNNGCTTTVEANIGIDTLSPLIITNDGIIDCNSPSVLIVGNSNSSQVTYQWTGPNAFLSNDSQVNISVPGDYTLLVTGENGCTSEKTIQVEDNRIYPAIQGEGGTLNCSIASVTLSGSTTIQGGQVRWEGPDGFIADEWDPETGIAGIYLLYVTDPTNGCESVMEVEVLEDPTAPSGVETDVSLPTCEIHSGSLQILSVIGGTGPFEYSIDGGNYFSPEVAYDQLEPGPYSLIVRDKQDCLFETEFEIPEVIAVEVYTDTIVEIQYGQQNQLQAILNIPENEVQSILWAPSDGLSCVDCLDPVVSSTYSRYYTVRVTDVYGCTDEARVFVLLQYDPKVYIPNVFSPFNKDGVNDYFTIYAGPEELKKISKLQIFNRWGEKLFENRDFEPNEPNHGWDGFFRGDMMNPGVYVYWAEIVFKSGERAFFKGDVTLIH